LAKVTVYLQQGLTLAQQLKDPLYEWQFLLRLGGTYSAVGENQKALEYYLPSLAVAQRLQTPKKQLESLENLIKIYESLQDNTKVKQYEQQRAAIAATLPQQPAGETDPALQALQEGEKLWEQGTKDSVQQAIPKLEQARSLAHAAGNRSTEALDYYTQALPLLQAQSDRFSKSVILNQIGNIYLYVGQPQRALDTLTQSLQLVKDAAISAPFTRTRKTITKRSIPSSRPQTLPRESAISVLKGLH